MKATITFEWRNIEDPTREPEEVIRGVWDEDKTKFFSVDGERLPHEEVVARHHERMTK